MYNSWRDQDNEMNHFKGFGKIHTGEKYLMKQWPEKSFTYFCNKFDLTKRQPERSNQGTVGKCHTELRESIFSSRQCNN